MVPGSTLRYGSSFWRETVRWRAFRMFPIDAAVIPLPREETTPPVTKTYFEIADLQGGFSNVTGTPRRLNLYFDFWLQEHDLRLVLADRGLLDRQLRLRLRARDPHLLEEPIHRVQLQLQPRDRVVHRHDEPRLELPDHLGRLLSVHGGPAPDGDQEHVRRRHRLRFGVVELVAEVAEVTDPHVVHLEQVDGVATLLGSSLRVVVGRESDHAHAGDLVLARPVNLVRSVTDDLHVPVVLVVVADRHQVGIHARKLQSDRGRIRIRDHGRVLASEPETGMTKPRQ